MPSSFTSFANGDVIQANHVSELQTPIKNLERGAAFYAGTSAGGTTAYTVTLSPAPDVPHQDGMLVNFRVNVQNTAGSPNVTLSVNGATAKPILKNGSQSLVAGDLKANQIVSLVFDATAQAFQLLAVNQVNSLDDLSDVVISSPSSGQVVRHNGTNFVNAAIAAGDITSGQLALARGGTNADLSATGGTSQFLRQSSAGAAVTVSVLAAADMPSAIDAAKIGGGAVSNTEFGYLDGVTSAIQTQINGKAATAHTHAAADITSGQLALAQGGTGASLSATGGTSQFLRQSSAGAAVTVSVLAAADMPSAIDAVKIGGGAVSNTEFGYLDGVTSPIQTQINSLQIAKVPVGMVAPFAGSTAPTGWLMCFGQNVSRSTYSALFTAISTAFGVGDGSTTFGLPDLRGRAVAGKDDMGGTSANRLITMVSGGTLGASGGAEQYALGASEIPSHTHSIGLFTTGGGGSQVIQGGWAYNNFATISSGSTGGNGAHTNTQPTLVLNYIIYVGA